MAAGAVRATDEFARLVAVPDDHINLARAALAIARLDYPGLDADRYLLRLDELADAIRDRLPEGATSPVDVVRAMNRYLFADQGFAGNAAEYYDPRNSFLNDVLDRRLGIPVTLSLVYLEVGWRLGLPLQGVPFPGHFLVKFPLDDGEVVLDPYHRGISLGLEDLAERARAALGDAASLEDLVPRILAESSKRQMLSRMLGNLKAIYAGRDDPLRTLQVLNLLLVLNPDDVAELRDRARTYQSLGNDSAAAADWRRYLQLLDEGEEAEAIRELLVELEQRPTRLH